MPERTHETGGPILVAVDFSPHSESALAWAARAARAFEVSMIVLHVVHDPESTPGSYAQMDDGGTRSMEQAARGMLEEFLSRARSRGVDLGRSKSAVAVGLPANRIVEVADLEGAQLIVVGSQGRTGLAHVLLGSKAERVAQLSPVPVTIVKTAGSE